MTCPVCGCVTSACPECLRTWPMGDTAWCNTCDAPVGCQDCFSAVAADLSGVLKIANDHT